MRPREGFSPTTPQHEAGTRIDPPPCGPSSSFVASLNPLSACYNFVLSLPHPLTQIKTRPPRSTMLSNARAGHGQKPRGGRRPRLPSEVRAGAGFRSLRPYFVWNDLDEMAGLAGPRASELRAVKATLAEIGQSRDDWRRRLRFAGCGNGSQRFAAGRPARPRCARPWRSGPRSAPRRPRNPSTNDRSLRTADGGSPRLANICGFATMDVAVGGRPHNFSTSSGLRQSSRTIKSERSRQRSDEVQDDITYYDDSLPAWVSIVIPGSMVSVFSILNPASRKTRST